MRNIVAADFSLRERTRQKPIVLAYNDIASDAPFQLPRTAGNNLPLPSVGEGWGEGSISNSAFAIPNWDTPNADSSPFLLAQQTADLPSPDDLSEAPPAIQFTPAIRAKAQDELSCNPTKIFNWVRNNINYEAYYGSFKSADQTLLESAGNDFDQASLLISLMRVCNISAKYAYGTVEITADQAANMVGVSDPKTAATILATQGIPVKTVMSGGTIKAIQMERAWVEAFIDYFPSWGARHKQGGEDTWIQLDPSFKQYAYKQGMDIYALMGFNADQFLQSYITNTNDVTSYQDYGKRLADFLATNYPNATLEDVFGAADISLTKTIVAQEFPYLLGTLPYRIIVKANQFTQAPPTKDYIITIKVDGNTSGGTDGLNYSGTLNNLAGKRVTVSYEPSTASDEAVIAYYGGNMITVPPYLLNVNPVLKIAGLTVATGAPIGLGRDQNITIGFAGPDGDTDRIQNIITAGAYAAIILQSQKTSAATVVNNMATFRENSKKYDLLSISLDDLLGQLLYSIGASYFQKISDDNEFYAKTLQIINYRQPAEAMVTFKVKVNRLFDVPRAISEGGINMDVDRNINYPISPTSDTAREKAFMVLSGLSSSAWENRILEVFFNIPAVSTVRILKLASEQQIPIYTITGANISDVLPQMEVSADVKTEIANAVNIGKIVIISKTNVMYHQWTGVGYIVLNPSTGAAGYMISGGLAGGDTAKILTDPPITTSKASLEYRLVKAVFINNIIGGAVSYIGTPWVYDGNNIETGIDCSHFTRKIVGWSGFTIPPGSQAQYNHFGSNDMLFNYPEVGDLYFYSNKSNNSGTDIGHVGFVVGVLGNTITIIDAISRTEAGEKPPTKQVSERDIDITANPYWMTHFVAFGRIIE